MALGGGGTQARVMWLASSPAALTPVATPIKRVPSIQRMTIVASSVVRRKKMDQQWMLDRVYSGGFFEVFFRHVGRRLRAINQYVIPGLVARRLGAIAVVPLVVGTAMGVERDDDAAIVVFAVVDDGADGPLDLHISR